MWFSVTRELVYRAVVSSAKWPSPSFLNMMRYYLLDRLEDQSEATRQLFLDDEK